MVIIIISKGNSRPQYQVYYAKIWDRMIKLSNLFFKSQLKFTRGVVPQ